MSLKDKELTQEDIKNLFLKVQNELNNIKKQQVEDKTNMLNQINSLKEEIEKKDKEIKVLRKTIEKLIHDKIESSKNITKISHKESKPMYKYTEEEIKYLNVFNQKFGTKITGNEKILDLSNDNNNNNNNKHNFNKSFNKDKKFNNNNNFNKNKNFSFNNKNPNKK